MFAVRYNKDTYKFEVFDGKKVKVLAKPPKVAQGDVILACDLSRTEINNLIADQVTVLQCSSAKTAEFQETHKIPSMAQAVWEYHTATPNAFVKAKADDALWVYYDLFKSNQKQRIAVGNKIRNIKTPLMLDHFKALETEEKRFLNAIADELPNYPIWTQWLSKVKGIGPAYGAGIIAILGDVTRFPSCAALWSFSGFAVRDGMIQKKKKGELANWNHRVKPLMHNIVMSFLKGHCPVYEPYYRQVRASEAKRGVTEMHAHNRAKRNTAKLFLSHYHEIYHLILNKPVRMPYVLSSNAPSDLQNCPDHVYIRPPYWDGKTVEDFKAANHYVPVSDVYFDDIDAMIQEFDETEGNA